MKHWNCLVSIFLRQYPCLIFPSCNLGRHLYGATVSQPTLPSLRKRKQYLSMYNYKIFSLNLNRACVEGNHSVTYEWCLYNFNPMSVGLLRFRVVDCWFTFKGTKIYCNPKYFLIPIPYSPPTIKYQFLWSHFLLLINESDSWT